MASARFISVNPTRIKLFMRIKVEGGGYPWECLWVLYMGAVRVLGAGESIKLSKLSSEVEHLIVEAAPDLRRRYQRRLSAKSGH